jgi:hypothetical protein
MAKRQYLQHDLVALRTQAWKRTRKGRSLVDRRSLSGQNALRVQAQLIADHGGVEQMSTAKLMIVELIYRDTWFLDESDRRIFRILRQYPKVRNNPAALHKLYSYRAPIVAALTRNLQLLGLERLPDKPKTLDDIFSEESHDGQDTENDSSTD